MNKILEFFIKPFDVVLTYLFVTRNKIKHKIASEVSISSDWTDIIISGSPKFRKNFQAVLLCISDCWRYDQDKDFRLSDGTIIKPEVKVIDEKGNEYSLRKSGYGAMPATDDCEKWSVSSIQYQGRISKDKQYARIMIRNDEPFQCSLYWYDYNLK